jgi:hypothetical protein
MSDESSDKLTGFPRWKKSYELTLDAIQEVLDQHNAFITVYKWPALELLAIDAKNMALTFPEGSLSRERLLSWLVSSGLAEYDKNSPLPYTFPRQSQFKNRKALEVLDHVIGFYVESSIWPLRKESKGKQHRNFRIIIPEDVKVKDNQRDMIESVVKAHVDDDTKPKRARETAELSLRFINALEEGKVEIENKTNAEYWVNEVFLPAGYGIPLFGRPGWGKTNLSSWIIETALVLHKDWVFFCNIPFSHEIPRVVKVKSMSELLKGIARSVLEGKRPAIVLDEFDSILNSRTESSPSGRALFSFFWQQRHLGVRGPIFIYHNWMSIPKTFRLGELTPYVVWIQHTGDGRAFAGDQNLEFDVQIPKTDLAYYHHGLASGLIVDVNVSRLFATLSGTQNEVAQQILERIDEFMVDPLTFKAMKQRPDSDKNVAQDEDERYREVREGLSRKLSIREIASQYGIPRSTVAWIMKRIKSDE